jgi:integrase
MPVTLHQGWPEGSLRPRCARSLDEEGGEVWLCGSAAASGTSGFQRFVRFALGTGCRLDEIRGIVPERDIDSMRGTVHVIGKFRKERDVPMQQPDARASLFSAGILVSLWRQNPQRLREVLAEGSARAKIPPLTPHVLRHTFGTRWLQAGGDI